MTLSSRSLILMTIVLQMLMILLRFCLKDFIKIDRLLFAALTINKLRPHLAYSIIKSLD